MSVIDQTNNDQSLYYSIENPNQTSSTILDLNFSEIAAFQLKQTLQNSTQINKHLQESHRLLMCPQFHQVYDICINQNCKYKQGMLCTDTGCKCRKNHIDCATARIQSIFTMIAEKTKRTNQIKDFIGNFFDKKIVQLLELRSYYLSQIQQNKEIQFSEEQKKFMKVIDIQNTDVQMMSMNGKQLSKLWKIKQKYSQNPQNNISDKIKYQFQKYNNQFKNASQSLKLDFNIMIDTFKVQIQSQNLSQSRKIQMKTPKINPIIQINKPLQKQNNKQKGSYRLNNFLQKQQKYDNKKSRQKNNQLNKNSAQKISQNRNDSQGNISANNITVRTPRNSSRNNIKNDRSTGKLPIWK